MATVFNLSLFFVYKYLNFAIANINALAGLFGGEAPLTPTGIVLPIGISFFTFQAMSYVFDVYYGRGRVQKNPLNTALYIALFPQLIAGPIVRYETVAEQIQHRQEAPEDFAKGIKRFILGLAKKAVLANSVAIVADNMFGYGDYSQLTVLMAWMGALAYSFQIYFDFSGYSDMAIGLGLLFGFHFEENFNYPYISRSVSEFWRRWHISLGSWFRDYVYIPLGGSRVKTKRRLVLNLFVVWFLTGMWHGAAWVFIAWGLMYFVLITFEKLTKCPQRFRRWWQRAAYGVFTLAAVVLGWVIFRSESLGRALAYMGSMFGLTGNRLSSPMSLFMLRQNAVLLALAAVFSMPVLPWMRRMLQKMPEKAAPVRSAVSFAAYMCVLIVAVAFTVSAAYNPFIYFNF